MDSSLLNQFPEINEKLIEVNNVLLNNIVVPDLEIKSSIQEIISGGKRIRPAIVLFSKQIAGAKIDSDSILLAAAIEAIHDATLIHDDIIDQSNIRRNKTTLNKKYGEDIAVYGGDLMLLTVNRLVSQISDPIIHQKAHQLVTNYTQNVIVGELLQKKNMGNLTVTFEQYLSQITDKTASLFMLSAEFGSIGVPLDKTINNVEAAKHFGIAFQLIDDYLDYFGQTNSLGKPALQDLQRGIFTAPLLLALQEKEEIKRLLEKKDYSDIINVIQETDIAQKTKKLITDETDLTIQNIRKNGSNEKNDQYINFVKLLSDRIF